MTKRKYDNNDNAYNKKISNLLQIKNPLMFTPKLRLVLTALMAFTGLIYCIAVLEESAQAGKEVAATLETIFFTTVAVAYFVIAIYVSSRIINFPIVGLQEDVGFIDMLSKVLLLVTTNVAVTLLPARIIKRLNILQNTQQPLSIYLYLFHKKKAVD